MWLKILASLIYSMYVTNNSPTPLHSISLQQSDAIPRTVRRKPVISHVTYFAPRPQTLPTTQRRDFFHYLRIVLPSRTNGRRNDQHRDPLDFPATSPLPRKYSYSAQEATKTHSRMNPYENSRPPITQSSTTFKARLRDLRTGHALSPIVDTPLAQGKERNAAADAPPKNNDWIPYEDHVPSRPPSPNPDSQPRPLPTVQINTGEHGSSRLCGCF
ncbi:hypothetical protein F4604DRAFT_1698298 [Suillus subluteus]|nr:hypothetical protein F4604DRAFT_1698298 [Suillus subluteus]